MRRPISQDSTGLAAWHRQQLARQERDERENRAQVSNPEGEQQWSYTRVSAAGSDLATAPDLGAVGTEGWQSAFQTHQGVEPIALELARQLVVGEAGIYDVTFDIIVIIDAPADPDDVMQLSATISAPDFSLESGQTTSLDPCGGSGTLRLSLHDCWVISLGTEVMASFDVSLLREPPPNFLFAATMVAKWVAPANVVTPVSSS